MKTNLRSLVVGFAVISALLVAPAFTQTLYWDSNNTTSGAGTTPTGIWGTDNFWSSNWAGTDATATWTSGSVAVFSAGNDAAGSFSVTVNGTQAITGLTVEEGTPTITGGSLSFTLPTNFNITGNATIASVLTGSGGRLDKSGSGTLTLTGANTYAGDSGTSLGTYVSFGTLAVTGGSISHSTTGIVVGLQSGDNGTLNITNGGDASSSSGVIGQQAGSAGLVTVDGSGSTWSTNSGGLNVGYAGTGTLNITNSGAVSLGSNAMQVGGADGSSASTGTLNITSGGTLTSTNGLIGAASGNASLGTVTIDGSGSSWTNINNLQVGAGNGSTGVLTVSNGGTISSNSGSGTINLGTVSGATGTLNIGAAAAGTAAAGGIVNAGTVATGGGLGTLQFKTTATSGSPYYFTKDGTSGGAGISITGAVKITNTAGYNVLFGTNNTTGVTTINGGTLALGNAGALSSQSAIILGGGTLDLVSFSPTYTTALAVTGNSFINFGGGNDALNFADSSANTWLGSVTLANFTVGSDFLGFGSATGLTGTQLGQISLSGYIASGLDGSGYVQFTAVPEPSTYALLAGLACLAAAVWRRRGHELGSLKAQPHGIKYRELTR